MENVTWNLPLEDEPILFGAFATQFSAGEGSVNASWLCSCSQKNIVWLQQFLQVLKVKCCLKGSVWKIYLWPHPHWTYIALLNLCYFLISPKGMIQKTISAQCGQGSLKDFEQVMKSSKCLVNTWIFHLHIEKHLLVELSVLYSDLSFCIPGWPYSLILWIV